MIAESRRSVHRITVGITTLTILLLLACAGTAAGATTWTADDDGGAGVDYMSIEAARLTDYHAQNDLYTIITPRAIDQW